MRLKTGLSLTAQQTYEKELTGVASSSCSEISPRTLNANRAQPELSVLSEPTSSMRPALRSYKNGGISETRLCFGIEPTFAFSITKLAMN
jgi:hypothetical protein